MKTLKHTLIPIFCLLLYVHSVAQDITGKWIGERTFPNGNKIEFVFEISKTEGKLNTVFSVPSQRVENMKPKSTTFKENKLVIDGSNLGMGYMGTLDKETQVIKGHFQEGPNKIPLDLKKSSTNKEPKPEDDNRRKQEPKKPYAYKSEDVSFKNNEAGIQLAGTLTLPRNIKNPPVAILISGSGPQDRDQTLFGHKPFLVLADHLTKEGIAVLRFDDRGAGDSEGQFEVATTADFASDVVSAVKYLKTRSDLSFSHIGLIGHSEGGIIAPMVANMAKKDVDFIVSLAGAGISGTETSFITSTTLTPLPVKDRPEFQNAVRKGIEIASQDGDIAQLEKELKAHYMENLAPIIRPYLGNDDNTEATINNLIQNRISPWSRYFYQYNPSVEFQKVKCPVLALNGSNDIQVPADIHLVAIEKALKNGKTKSYEVKIIDGLNHFFQTCKECTMAEYQKLEETFSPEAMSTISSWILKQTI
ncbi:MAG: alpha/beta fold hydrolase [Ekhidna sp.]